MAVSLSPEILVLLDREPGSEAALEFAARCGAEPVILATVDARYPDGDLPVVRSLSSAPTMTEVLKTAAQRQIPMIAMRRDVADPATLVGELIIGAGRAQTKDLPGFAVVLAGTEDRPIQRILAVADRATGPISGFMTYMATALAARNGAELDVLVIGAPGEEIDSTDEHEALAVNREQEYLDEALALAQRRGVTTTWLTSDSVESTWTVVGNLLRSGKYDLVVDEIGELTISGQLRKGITVEEAMSPGHTAELALHLLDRCKAPVVVVIDSVRVGIPMSPIVKAGALAAAAVALVAGGAMTTSDAGAGRTEVATTAELAAEEDPGAARARDTLESLEGAPEGSPEAAAAQALLELTEAQQVIATEKERASQKKQASRSASKEITQAKPAKPKVPKRGARKADVTAAKADQKAAKAAADKAKAKLAEAKAAEKEAALALSEAQSTIEDSILEVTTAAAVLDQKASTAQEVQSDATGLTGLLPGGATKEDAEYAQGQAQDAQEWVEGAAARATDALTDVEDLAAAQAEAAAELAKREEKAAQAEAELADARAQAAAVSASYEEYLQAQEAKRIAAEKAAKAKAAAEAKAKAAAEAKARAAAAARAKALANSKVSPVAAGNYRISARYGQSGPYWSSGYHTGLDFAASSGTTVRAAASGTVTRAGWAGAYGNQIEISHGNGVTTTYNHLSSMTVSPGQKVTAGQKIGGVGSTGNSTGPHLHFEVFRNGSRINPASWLGM